jgi:hypothetical protein
VYDKWDVSEKLEAAKEVPCSLLDEELSGRKFSITGLFTARYLLVTIYPPKKTGNVTSNSNVHFVEEEENKKRELEAMGLTIFGNA